MLLNFGCPHGMAERGMRSASGQVPELVEKYTYWAKETATTPVIVKLTPNIIIVPSLLKCRSWRCRCGKYDQQPCEC
jgi:dihydroorotate dehydrogenase